MAWYAVHRTQKGEVAGFIMAGDGDDDTPASWDTEDEVVSHMDGHPLQKAGLVEYIEL